jgi:hypothetical protein
MKVISNPRKGAERKRSSESIPHLPMEWMDPMSWRLPSGKALAEFALQAGFLAPLIISGPRIKKRAPSPPGPLADTTLRQEEVPGPSGTFREPAAFEKAGRFRRELPR